MVAGRKGKRQAKALNCTGDDSPLASAVVEVPRKISFLVKRGNISLRYYTAELNCIL